MHLTSATRLVARNSSRHVRAAHSAAINAFVSDYITPSAGALSVAVKDNICTKGWHTTCASNTLRNFTSPLDASAVAFLKEAGATIVGKTNCDEFGMGSLNLHSIHGPVVNPHDLTDPRSPGGSSGGSAAAVAAGLCDASLGTDTGGSIRLPASYCGVYGLKPSYGLVSRWGVVSYADSLDCVGVFASKPHPLKRVFDIISRPDSRDATCASAERRDRVRDLQHARFPERPWESLDDSNFNGLRVGVPQEYFPAELDPNIANLCRAFLTKLRERGATIVPVSLPSTAYALSAYYVIASAEASSNLARYDGVRYGTHVSPPITSDRRHAASVYALSRSAGFGPEVQQRILLGTYALTAELFESYFLQATRVRELLIRDFDSIFALPNCRRQPFGHAKSIDEDAEALLLGNSPSVDVLVHPSAIRTAPRLHEAREKEDTAKLDAYVQDVLTVPASLAGLPALNVPAGVGADGWPVGISLVGQWGADRLLIELAEILARSENVERTETEASLV